MSILLTLAKFEFVTSSFWLLDVIESVLAYVFQHSTPLFYIHVDLEPTILATFSITVYFILVCARFRKLSQETIVGVILLHLVI